MEACPQFTFYAGHSNLSSLSLKRVSKRATAQRAPEGPDASALSVHTPITRYFAKRSPRWQGARPTPGPQLLSASFPELHLPCTNAPWREPRPALGERRGGGGGAAHAQGPAARAERGAPRGAATMEGGAYGAGKAGGAFDPYTLVRQPHTILRVVSWVRTPQGGARGTGATSPGPGGPADTSGSGPLPPSSSARSLRPPKAVAAFTLAAQFACVRGDGAPSSRPLIGGRGSGRGSFSRAHCCTCRALSG